MQIGDLVRWTDAESTYHELCGWPSGIVLTKVRQRGIIVDKNPVYFFVRWENNDFLAQRPEHIEVISESR